MSDNDYDDDEPAGPAARRPTRLRPCPRPTPTRVARSPGGQS